MEDYRKAKIEGLENRIEQVGLRGMSRRETRGRMNLEEIEKYWLKEVEAIQRWQWGINKSQLKEKFPEIKFWTERLEEFYVGKQYMLFGGSASVVFSFTENEKLSKVKILWESPTSGAYLQSKLTHIKSILDEVYGKSEISDSSILWERNEDTIELSIDELENRIIMQFKPKNTSST